MNAVDSLAAILVMAAVTLLTRAIPFLLFDRGKQPPALLLRLSRTLPAAIMAMLVIYCFRTTQLATPAGWVPGVAAGLGVVALQVWKRNDLLSILGGTLLYMGLLHFIG